MAKYNYLIQNINKITFEITLNKMSILKGIRSCHSGLSRIFTNKIYYLNICLLLITFSCEKQENVEVKNSLPQINNFELKNISSNGFDYQIKSAKAIDKKLSILADNVNIDLKTKENSFNGKAENIEFIKSSNNIVFNNIKINGNDLTLISSQIQFNENKGILNSSNTSIESPNITIKGDNLKTDKTFKTLSLKKVKAKISY